MTNFKRIRYNEYGYSNSKFATVKGLIRIRILEAELKYQIVNADKLEKVLAEVTAKSMVMLKRKIKKHLAELMNVTLPKESRPGRKGKRIGGLPSKPGKLL